MSAGKESDDEAERRTFDAAVADAQAAVAGLSDKYIGWVNDDLKRLDAAIARLGSGSDPAALQAVYDVSHDIKGQGRSEERRVGKEWVSPLRPRWSPYH